MTNVDMYVDLQFQLNKYHWLYHCTVKGWYPISNYDTGQALFHFELEVLENQKFNVKLAQGGTIK